MFMATNELMLCWSDTICPKTASCSGGRCTSPVDVSCACSPGSYDTSCPREWHVIASNVHNHISVAEFQLLQLTWMFALPISFFFCDNEIPDRCTVSAPMSTIPDNFLRMVSSVFGTDFQIQRIVNGKWLKSWLRGAFCHKNHLDWKCPTAISCCFSGTTVTMCPALLLHR